MWRIWCSMKLSPVTSSLRQGTPPGGGGEGGGRGAEGGDGGGG
jgi:hypothetical protein